MASRAEEQERQNNHRVKNFASPWSAPSHPLPPCSESEMDYAYEPESEILKDNKPVVDIHL